MVSLMAAMGVGAMELFKYNRENYKFDQDQRIERELLRVEMQVKRFELFREDIRDLVELTVDRMDVYHLVGALILEFCVVFFCEGRIQGSAPPFLLSLFLLSNACAFSYLLLAVWLSMHASIAAHSFGVRLLTRFVRLPIPSPQQINTLNARLAEFEFQDVDGLLRLPFLQSPEQKWQRASSESLPVGLGSATASPATVPRSLAPGAPPAPSAVAPAPAVGSSASGATTTGADVDGNVADVQGPEEARMPDNLLGQGEPFDEEHLLLRGTALPERHVQLFRRLQAKWQCYDAYCRVCMTLGVNQILQGLTYYSICHTLVENRSPSCGYALLIVFQAVALAVARMDISGLYKWQILAIQAVGTLPALLSAGSVHAADRDERGGLNPHTDYPASPYMFFLQAFWLELLLWVAKPSDDDAALPRRFRSVLFLDVFGDAEDPFEAEHRPNALNVKPNNDGRAFERLLMEERVAAAESALDIAHAAIRRWEAVPSATLESLSDAQREELGRIRAEFTIWRRALHGEIAWRAARHGRPHAVSVREGEQQVRPWGELSEIERSEDPFACCLLGPFEHDTGYSTTVFHFDIDTHRYVWDLPRSSRVLTMQEMGMAVRGLEASTRLLLGTSEVADTDQHCAHTESSEEPDRGSSRSMPARFASMVLHWLSTHGLSAVREIELIEHLDRPLLRQNSGGSLSPRIRSGRGRRRLPSDPLVTAAAGPQARHFVPERLPWQMMRGVTRVLQFCWVFTGTMAVLREVGLYRIDFQQHPGKERRLTGSETDNCNSAPRTRQPQLVLSANHTWRFERLQVDWPHKAFFRPEALSCFHSTTTESELNLIVGTPFALFKLIGSRGNHPMKLQDVPETMFPPGTTVLCRATPAKHSLDSDSCILGRAEPPGVLLWPYGEDHRNGFHVTVIGKPWQAFAGAIFRCARIAEMMGPGISAAATNQVWCLLLVGWDGQRIPVIVLTFPSMRELASERERRVRPVFDLPLHATTLHQHPPAFRASSASCAPSQSADINDRCSTSSADTSISALHMDPQDGHLWAIHGDGSVQAWSLLSPQALGFWRPQWPLEVGNFEAAAICEVHGRGMLVTGRGDIAGAELFWARYPPEFPKPIAASNATSMGDAIFAAILESS